MSERNLTWSEFERVEMRVGTVKFVRPFPAARNPSFLLYIDFGAEIGTLKSSAQITERYTPGILEGKQVVAVVNFPPKQIANVMSECLVLGSLGEDNIITLLTPEQPVQNGLRIG